MGAGSLSALLSQVLVAFTIEFDNEFERRMGEAGYPGARLSLMVWTHLMRYVDTGISVGDLTKLALLSGDQGKLHLGCLERWRFVAFDQASPAMRRNGWGSGRGIRADWIVRLTSRGVIAGTIWPRLFEEIEQRWQRRFGIDTIRQLRECLSRVADQDDESLPLPTLLWQLLQIFRVEFERESPTPLVLYANTLRVLGEKPIRLAEISHLTGASPEMSAVGWQIKPYVVVAPDPTASRGKVVHLSPRGVLAQQTYERLVREIEKRWEERFGGEAIAVLRELLRGLFDRIAEGLVAPAGTARAGDQAPALGRADVGPAARQRMRELVAQTEDFVRDPAGALPHFPAWDMNRGFGP